MALHDCVLLAMLGKHPTLLFLSSGEVKDRRGSPSEIPANFHKSNQLGKFAKTFVISPHNPRVAGKSASRAISTPYRSLVEVGIFELFSLGEAMSSNGP
jgi:hypothetical protein